jgi:MOSC domain-containing protein YiiM
VAFGSPPGIAWRPLGGTEPFEAVERGFLVAPADVALWAPPRPAAPPAAGSVEAIVVASRAEEAMMRVDRALAWAGRGLEGDRNLSPPDRWIGAGNALTLIEAEAIEAVLEEHALDLRDGRSRRQLVTRGIPLNDLVGREFSVGSVRCRGVELCEPCLHLQQLLGRKDAIKAMVHRGGLRADILDGGMLSVGDPITAA